MVIAGLPGNFLAAAKFEEGNIPGLGTTHKKVTHRNKEPPTTLK
jgi:hypothetical protein